MRKITTFLFVAEESSSVPTGFVIVPTPNLARDSDLADFVHEVRKLTQAQKRVCVVGPITDVDVVAGCYRKGLGFASPVENPRVRRYRPPIRVIFCGTRENPYVFENAITKELTSLPRHSVVRHGACKGVDLYVADLASILPIEVTVEAFPADWDLHGLAAGPIRNKAMLDAGTDLVIAFHPAIEESKGTKNMMSIAHAAGVPVYLHDYKRKYRFAGSFEVDEMIEEGGVV